MSVYQNFTTAAFVLFDTGTYLRCPMQESERQVRPYGALGRYLHEYRHVRAHFGSDRKGFFDLGDVAALVDPGLACWEETECPGVLLSFSVLLCVSSVALCVMPLKLYGAWCV